MLKYQLGCCLGTVLEILVRQARKVFDILEKIIATESLNNTHAWKSEHFLQQNVKNSKVLKPDQVGKQIRFVETVKLRSI